MKPAVCPVECPACHPVARACFSMTASGGGLRLRWPELDAAALLAPVAALLAAAVLLALLAAVALLALIAAVALLAAAALLVAAPASLIVPAAPLPALLTPIRHPSQLEDSFLLPEGQLEDREGAA